MSKVKEKLFELFDIADKKTDSKILVSIIIPIRYPSREEIERTFSSINDLENKDFELVLVFDGYESTKVFLDGGNSEISDEINVRITTLEQVSGPSVTRNVGVFSSTGNIVSYMDIGDEINVERIDHLKSVFENLDELEILFSAFTVSHPSAGMQFFDTNKKFQGVKVGSDLLNYNNYFPAISVAHRRIPFYVSGGFQPNIKSGEEELLWRRMVKFIPNNRIAADNFNAGIKHYQDYEGKDYPHFEIDTKNKEGANGQYLDDWWSSNMTNSYNGLKYEVSKEPKKKLEAFESEPE